MVQLNVGAVVDLTYRLLPGMLQRGHGAIVNVSSLSAFQPVAYMAVYAATKAFGIVLAEGLWAELRRHGVDVLACVAGAVSTPGLVAAKARQAPGTLPPVGLARSWLTPPTSLPAAPGSAAPGRSRS